MANTIFFPDVANFQRGLVIQPGTVFVWAKATEGTSFKDNTYPDFKSQAAKVDAGFGAYHFLHSGNGAAQADFAFSVVGRGVPLFVDVEPTGTSYPTVADVKAFTARYRALGGTCEVMYYPKWYWSSQGSPSLSVTGLKLISSGYPAGYSDSAANWDPYGGLTPFQWQFSDSYEYGGYRVDFNAFKGTIDEYLVAIGAKTSTPAPPPPPPVTIPEEDIMVILAIPNDPGRWLLTGGSIEPLQDSLDVSGLTAAGVKTAEVSKVFVNSLLTKAGLPPTP
jgi:lysozyme